MGSRGLGTDYHPIFRHHRGPLPRIIQTGDVVGRVRVVFYFVSILRGKVRGVYTDFRCFGFVPFHRGKFVAFRRRSDYFLYVINFSRALHRVLVLRRFGLSLHRLKRTRTFLHTRVVSIFF